MGKREATRVPKALSAVEWAAFAFLIDAFEGGDCSLDIDIKCELTQTAA